MPQSPMGPEHRKEGVLYVGIDLGTSRTSVAASNGVRETVYSYVGYPKDVVSRKLLKQDVLFGREALKHRLSLNLYRPLEKGVIKYSSGEAGADSDAAQRNMKAAKDLVKRAIQMARPRADELIYGVIGCPAQASINNKTSIIDAAKEVLDSVMICSEPFAVAYGLDYLDETLVIDIGAGTVDLCRMHGTMPEAEDQLTLTTAGDHVDRVLFSLLKEKCAGAQFNVNMVKDIKEKHGFVTDQAATQVRVPLPVNGKPTLFDVTDEVRAACMTIVMPIIKAIQKLIGTYDPEFQDRLKNHVLLGGGGSQIIGLGDKIEEAMERELGGGKVQTVEEPIYAGANGALKLAHDMPAEYWEQLK